MSDDATITTGGGAPPPSDEQRFSQTFEKLKQEAQLVLEPMKMIEQAMIRLVSGAESLNSKFLENRKRMVEMMDAVVEATPEILRLGGQFSDVNKTIEDAAAAQRRNVIETKETLGELFATSKLLNKDVATIVTNFDKVGINASLIGERVSEGIEQVQKLGLNARNVMTDVVNNTDKLSRYNFSEGVVGLTKMAAQASMLRFDMKETFQFAEDVLNPDRAIEMSSAFQRLGVSVGNLTDPFQLMNQSLTDPSGLQTSLIEMTKQFTYFDEEAKQFKINPQGILTLKELARETNISFNTLTETALASANLDERLKALGRNKFAQQLSEDDKKLLANVAKMGEGGEYVVTIGPDQEQVRLDEATQEQLLELKKELEKPKMSVEEYQKHSLDIAQNTAADIRAMNATIQKGITGEGAVQKLVGEGLEGIRGATSSLANIGNTQMADILSDLKAQLKAADGNPEKIKEAFEKAAQKTAEQSVIFFGNLSSKLQESIGSNTILGKQFEKLLGLFGNLPQINTRPEERPVTPGGGTGPRTVQPGGTGPRVVGVQSPGTTDVNAVPITPTLVQNNVSGKVDVSGTVVVKVDSPSNIGQDQLRTIFETAQDPLRATVYDMVESERKKRIGTA